MITTDIDEANRLINYRTQLEAMREYLLTATGVVAISALEPNISNGRFIVNSPVIAVRIATIGPGLLNVVSGQLTANEAALTALGIGIAPTGVVT